MKKTMNKTTKNNFINYGIVIAIFVIVEILSGTGNLSRLLTGLLVPLCVYTIAAISLNLVVGFSGELSLGHAGFMCVGAYSSALFSHIASDIPQVPRFILAILIGAAVAAVFGVIIGIPVLRLRGDYLAIVTLAFGEIIKNLINILYVGFDENGLHVATSSANLKLAAGGKQILKGALGISGTGALYKDVKHYFFPIGIILVLLTLFIVQNLVNSRSGRAIMATRDNRIAAESVGIDVTKFKLLAFTISAALAGVAGVLYAHNLSMLKVSGFDYNMSILILVYVVLGGIGNLRGSMIATIILYALPELLRGFANYRMLIYAIVLIVMMLFNWAPAARNWRARTMEKIRGTKNKGGSLTMAMLEVNHLAIQFGGLRAVDGFNVSIEKGQLYGLIGPNGAGKTTIFNLLTGVYKPTEGIIKPDGQDITGKSTIEINKAGIARTFQNIRLFKDMPVLDNVKVGLHNHHSYSTLTGILRLPKYHKVEKEMNEKAMEILKVFDLDKEADTLAGNLPYGKQRKLEIARALATNPKLLLLDEPAAGMNPNETQELMDTIRFVQKHFDMTILLIEHDMKLVGGICEELTVLNFGQVLAQGETSKVLKDPAVITAYLGE